MAAEVLNILSPWAIGELFHFSLGGGIGYARINYKKFNYSLYY